jgi:hypothetical protein
MIRHGFLRWNVFCPEVVPDVLQNKAVFLPKNIFFSLPLFQHKVLSPRNPELERVPQNLQSFIWSK